MKSLDQQRRLAWSVAYERMNVIYDQRIEMNALRRQLNGTAEAGRRDLPSTISTTSFEHTVNPGAVMNMLIRVKACDVISKETCCICLEGFEQESFFGKMPPYAGTVNEASLNPLDNSKDLTDAMMDDAAAVMNSACIMAPCTHVFHIGCVSEYVKKNRFGDNRITPSGIAGSVAPMPCPYRCDVQMPKAFFCEMVNGAKKCRKAMIAGDRSFTQLVAKEDQKRKRDAVDGERSPVDMLVEAAEHEKIAFKEEAGCIVVRGKGTYVNKRFIAQCGFKWDAEKKVWAAKSISDIPEVLHAHISA